MVCFSNFVVSITFPRLLGAFKPQGAFGWYAGWKYVIPTSSRLRVGFDS